MTILLVIFLISFVVSFGIFPVMIPALKRAGITGRDMHKPDQPEIAEMGGLAIVVGFCAGIVVAIALNNFTNLFYSINLQPVLAVLSTVLITVLIGILDDLISVRQWLKAIAPLFSALPLMAVRVGYSTIFIPFVGQVDLGILYSLILVPIGITVAANGVNMLAGFNGLEVGMGMVSMAALAIIAFRLGETTALTILLAALGALIATFRYNWYPAKIFIGDVGTLSMGAIMASAVIIGNFEAAGVIVMIPYAIDFFIKARNRFPSQDWWGIHREGKLYCPEQGVMGLGQLIMKLAGGIRERNLTLILVGVEAACGVAAVLMFW